MSARKGRGTEKSQKNSSRATREQASEILARESSKDIVYQYMFTYIYILLVCWLLNSHVKCSSIPCGPSECPGVLIKRNGMQLSLNFQMTADPNSTTQQRKLTKARTVQEVTSLSLVLMKKTCDVQPVSIIIRKGTIRGNLESSQRRLGVTPPKRQRTESCVGGGQSTFS